MPAKNIFDSIRNDLDHEVVEQLIESDSIKIERIISTGQTSPPTGWYDQALNEWVMVLKGGAVITFEDGEVVELEAGSYLNIPAHRKHRVSWTAPGTATVWLAVHY